MSYAWVLAFNCMVTAALLALFRPLALRINLTDIPNHRKNHEGAVPLVGGIAIYAGLLSTFLLLGLPIDRHVAALLLAGGILVTVGVIDDWIEVPPLVRLVAQATAALILCFGGVVVADLGELLVPGHTIALGVLAVPFTTFAVVALINSVNMSDGLDGLAGSQTLISLGGIAAVTVLAGQAESAVPLLAVCGGVVAFLAFNLRRPFLPRASVFLGDAGSNFLGLVLAWALIRAAQAEPGGIMPAAALWFVSLQVFDTVEIVVRRIVRRRSPFDADREHLHHVFLLAGFTISETVLAMGLFAAGGVVVGVLAVALQPPDGAVFFGFVVSCGVFLAYVLRTWRTMHFLRRSICRRRSIHDRRRTPGLAWAGPERRSGLERRSVVPGVAYGHGVAADAAQSHGLPTAYSIAQARATGRSGGDDILLQKPQPIGKSGRRFRRRTRGA
ncbi:MAG: undecaprenyl/decaprenyl-phosphate alpha-N-acetylglucosaminyl 1-phosphate transferase [Gammaproteobacteria bacterium]|nr:undecaprenyl/decaprenyl-phosphate alpha-N-acetylglucosaminyl 1-phosphate transferase [Gammaproteobacteria bacterium]